MIIHQPEIFTHEGHVILWAKIEMDTPGSSFPKYLWYRVPEKYASNLSLQSDAFLVPGLLGGMYYREPIRVRGKVSPRLAYHLDEYQYVLSHTMSGAVQPVDIQYERLHPLDANPRAVGATFSGGVDSFFTLLKHAPQNQLDPEYQFTHCLFINGFDIVRKDNEKYKTIFTHYQKTLAEINIELVPIETNVANAIVPRLVYNQYFSIILAGSTLALGGLFKRFTIASSYDFELIQKGIHSSSSPLMDRVLSTETLDFEHHGANYTRAEKVAAISDWKLAQENLRVCGMPNLGPNLLNCSQCEKCTRTMIPLYAIGKIEKFTTFQEPLVSNRDLLRWARKFAPYSGFVQDIFKFIQKQNPSLLPWLRTAAFLGTIRYWLIRLIPMFVKDALKPYGYFNDYIKEENAFETPEVLEWITDYEKK
ncbi:MAG: hypothetical protein HZB50_08410 [Chloroflexi bacterium]|nr:hypothetical protein [Chloroflexota bacterium]